MAILFHKAICDGCEVNPDNQTFIPVADIEDRIVPLVSPGNPCIFLNAHHIKIWKGYHSLYPIPYESNQIQTVYQLELKKGTDTEILEAKRCIQGICSAADICPF